MRSFDAKSTNLKTDDASSTGTAASAPPLATPIKQMAGIAMRMKDVPSTGAKQGSLYQGLLAALLKWDETQTKSPFAEALQKRASHFGFRCHNVLAEGNCFFLAVLHQLQLRDPKKYADSTDQQLREKTVQHILDYLVDYQHALTEDVNEFIIKISKPGAWAEDIVIPALSRVCDITIVIVRHDGSKPNVYRRPNPEAIVYLGYEIGLHYQSLVRDTDSKTSNDIQGYIDSAEVDLWQPGIRTQAVGNPPTAGRSLMVGKPPTAVEQLIIDVTPLKQREVTKIVMEYLGTDLSRAFFFQAFEEKAAAKETKDLPAVLFGMDPKLSYSELNKRANQLAHFLLAKKQILKLADNVLVGLFFYQSVDYVISVLAVMKAGLAFMPLSANTKEVPDQRLIDYVQDSNVRIILTNSNLKFRPVLTSEKLKVIDQVVVDEMQTQIMAHPVTNPPAAVALDQLAYVHNTSGSTGTPKKVLIKHRGIMNCVRGHIDLLQLDSTHRVAAFADLAFDAHLIEIMMTLAAGACLYPVPPDTRTDFNKLKHFYRTNNITVSIFTPSMLRELNREDFSFLRVIISTGEEITKELIEKWQPLTMPPLLFINGYGPAEVTIATSMAILKPDDEVHIGKEIPGLRMMVLEQKAKLPDRPPKYVKPGEVGELYIAGEGLGAYADETLHTKRFLTIPDPANPEDFIQVFRTRDAAEIKADKIYLKGRLGRELKFYGKLIDPRGTEYLLRQPGNNIKHVYVAIKKDEGGHPYFTAYFELQDKSQPIDLRKLYNYLARKLTASMVPSRWVVVDQMPLSASRKVDANKLLAMKQSPLRVQGSGGIKASEIKSSDNLEQELAELWRELLGIENKELILQIDDSFLELGGTSLQQSRLLEILRSKYKLRLTMEEFYHSPTIAALSRKIRRSNKQLPETPEIIPLINGKESNATPLFIVHSLMGNPERDYEKLKPFLLVNRSVYVIRARGLNNPDDMDDNLAVIAADYVQAIKKVQPHGPYLLGGWSAGGVIASVMSVQLRSQNEEVALLMIDSEPPETYQAKPNEQYAAFLLHLFKHKLAGQLGMRDCGVSEKELAKRNPQEQVRILFAHLLQQVKAQETAVTAGDAKSVNRAISDINRAILVTVRDILLAMLGHQMQMGLNNVTLLAANATQEKCKSDRLAWPACVTIEKIIKLEGDHESIVLDQNNAQVLAKHINDWCVQQNARANTDAIARQLRENDQPDLNKEELEYYIPVSGCRNNNYSQSFDLLDDKRGKEGVIEFLKSNKKVLLLLGNSGAGKTLFCQCLTQELPRLNIAKNPIVLYIPLANYVDPLNNLIEKRLKQAGLTEEQIRQLKVSEQRFVFILDGYDEIKTGLYQNLYAANKLYEWKNVHVIISCRSSYLLNAGNYRAHFAPVHNSLPEWSALTEITLVPFSDTQIDAYIKKYLQKNTDDKTEKAEQYDAAWYRKYIDTLPGLKALINTPFLLRILMEVLPVIVKEYESIPFDQQLPLTVAKLYDYFMQNYFERQLGKLIANGNLPKDGHDVMIDFRGFSRQLAITMWKKDVKCIVYKPATRGLFASPVTEETNPWEVFFSNSNEDMVRAREGCPIRRLPNEEKDDSQRWAFIHYSLQEYFASTEMFQKSLEADVKSIKEARMQAEAKANAEAKEKVDEKAGARKAEPVPPKSPFFASAVSSVPTAAATTAAAVTTAVVVPTVTKKAVDNTTAMEALRQTMLAEAKAKQQPDQSKNKAAATTSVGLSASSPIAVRKPAEPKKAPEPQISEEERARLAADEELARAVEASLTNG